MTERLAQLFVRMIVTPRKEDHPIVAVATPSETPQVLNAAREDNISFLIVDTAPHTAPDATRVVSIADFILIPCRPTAFDLAAVSSSADIVQAARTPAAFVLNACPARAPEVEEAREALGSYGLPIVPVTIGERRAFSRAVASGRAVTEFEASSKAANEIRSLWKWLKKHL